MPAEAGRVVGRTVDPQVVVTGRSQPDVGGGLIGEVTVADHGSAAVGDRPDEAGAGRCVRRQQGGQRDVGGRAGGDVIDAALASGAGTQVQQLVIGKRLAHRRVQKTELDGHRVAIGAAQREGVVPGLDGDRIGRAVLVGGVTRAHGLAQRVLDRPAHPVGASTELVPGQEAGLRDVELVRRSGPGLIQCGGGTLAQNQAGHLRALLEEGETVRGGGGAASNPFYRQPVSAAGGGDEIAAVIVHAAGAGHDVRMVVVQRPADTRVALPGLEKQAVASLNGHGIQRSLVARRQHARHRLVGCQRRGRRFAEQAEDIAASAVALSLHVQLVGAGRQLEKRVGAGLQIAAGEAGCAGRPLQLPLDLVALYAVEQHARRLIDDKLIAVLLTRLIDRTLDAMHSRNRVAR